MNFRRVSYSTKEGIAIWCILNCCGQEEQAILTKCKDNMSSEVLLSAFVLTYDRMRRYEGTWHLERKPMFPGYVFLESGNADILAKELGRSSGIGREDDLIRLNCEEEAVLKGLCGKKRHLEMSRGIISQGTTRIIEGPLKGMESRICRIDRHKRLAEVALIKKSDCFKYLQFIPAGLEITEKTI